MASALRPTLIRQALAMPSSRLTTSAIPALRTQQYFLRRAPLALQQATFQTSSKRAILPPLPQRMEGTVNDAVRLPPSEPSHGNYHWTFERWGSTYQEHGPWTLRERLINGKQTRFGGPAPHHHCALRRRIPKPAARCTYQMSAYSYRTSVQGAYANKD
ncbi:membrane anchor subunit of succinate dehydrogenase, Sdh4 [Friedmanniomyces endolithicus]|uniref:Membrane anchor subunit of succinate dehydrogenase, Sdh4 n=1 Tax=Friedmanniomyces endolithicus TaxID=329885 RepID=A0AAN6H823_9PEZI|nr:membrane anchor subunit of succinate dehydrogenase, Sdh4 [Friedmanniomyces endolithicus]KAK0857320.1 membrane anchor subunit of succinate dehydrogenase, Sdh4 [Friedmanniomyces endolithicus]KAK0883457.1 membrane anchor subunit of succinate dehydrogenase, Sdh4 [Friedmanniomyces endolithicus]KAK0892922.1 membrane anchor subunit of succinate dehydrogenase, Sdh4 [Friedmanniomyces endolithicus]KAK0953341.1 membrane anchor subunit of succinate dehydrogenase, Sdh4 [Friedmanniomyces endolithicus]